ncbi:MAG: Uncharacterised protein [Synechococcus sp. MIT S9220]|nr:MAG: Uncharacterised protein [Synechococcus sp. MIT S9220]
MINFSTGAFGIGLPGIHQITSEENFLILSFKGNWAEI